MDARGPARAGGSPLLFPRARQAGPVCISAGTNRRGRSQSYSRKPHGTAWDTGSDPELRGTRPAKLCGSTTDKNSGRLPRKMLGAGVRQVRAQKRGV